MPEQEHAPSEKAAEKEPPGAPASPPEPRPGKRHVRQKKPVLTEEQVNSPDRLTLVLLAIVFAVSVLSWGAARFACNLQAPESKAPGTYPTTLLASTARDAAIEFQQRWRTQDYSGALELAKGPLVQAIEQERRECESHGVSECERKREALQREVVTTASVLSQYQNAADVRATSYLGQTRETYRLHMEQDGPIWKATSRTRE